MSPQGRPQVFTPKLVVGLSVIALGILLLLESLHWYDPWRCFSWWPLLLAVYGAACLVQDGWLSLRGHVWLALALSGLLSLVGPWDFLDRWWPIFLVWGGCVIALRAVFSQPKRERHPKRLPPSSSAPVSCDPESRPDQVQP
jgi:hypothetical protein